MLGGLRHLLTQASSQKVDRNTQERLAAALLLAEMARADFEIAEVEREKIRELLMHRYALSWEQAAELADRALAGADRATSMYEYVSTLNDRLDYPGKCELVEMMWQVANADGQVDSYEEHELRKLAGLLYVSDSDFIRAKLSALGD